MSQISPDEWTERETLLRRQFEEVCFHAIGLIDRNREYLQIHLKADEDECVQQALDDIENETVRLERTLDELMALLRLREEETPQLEEFDLREILHILEEMQPGIERKTNVKFAQVCQLSGPCIVRANRAETKRLLLHLLSNALLACAGKGSVTLSLDEEETNFRLVVADDGCGLPTKENWLENRRCFRDGVQAGLLLCREYCRHAGWSLTLHDRPQGGTQAELCIPKCSDPMYICQDLEMHAPISDTDSVIEDELKRLLRRELYLMPQSSKNSRKASGR